MPKSTGKAWDICKKSSKTRAKMYKKGAIKKVRSGMCSGQKFPRCVKGMAYCVKKQTSKKSKKSKKKSKSRSKSPLRLK